MNHIVVGDTGRQRVGHCIDHIGHVAALKQVERGVDTHEAHVAFHVGVKIDISAAINVIALASLRPYDLHIARFHVELYFRRCQVIYVHRTVDVQRVLVKTRYSVTVKLHDIAVNRNFILRKTECRSYHVNRHGCRIKIKIAVEHRRSHSTGYVHTSVEHTG